MRGLLCLAFLLAIPCSARAVEPVPVTLPTAVRVTIAGAGIFNGVYVCRPHPSVSGLYVGPTVNGAPLIVSFGAYRVDRQSAEIHTHMRVSFATHVFVLTWTNNAPDLPAWNVICAPDPVTPGVARVESL